MQPARQALQVVLLGDANRTMHGMGNRRDRRHRLARIELGDGGMHAVRLSTFPGKRDLRGHAHQRDMLRHDADLMLDRLELADRASELDAVVGVLERHVEDPHHRAGHLRRMQGGADRAQRTGRQRECRARRACDADREITVDAGRRHIGGIPAHQPPLVRVLCQEPAGRRPIGHEGSRLPIEIGQCDGTARYFRSHGLQQRAREYRLRKR